LAEPDSLSRSRRHGWLAAGLVAGALVRIVVLPAPGSPDVGSWKIWAFAGSFDATSLYGVGGHPPERRLMHWNGVAGTTEYPPLALYEIAAIGRIYAARDPTFSDSPALTRLIKVPGLVAESLFVAAILVWGRRRLGPSTAAWIALAFWLNPAVILNGAALGYLDAQMAVPAALALLAVSMQQWAAGGALIAIAVLTKAQAIFAIPAILLAGVYVNRPREWRRLVEGAAGAAATAAAVLLPIVIRGAWPNMIQAVRRLAAHDMVSGNALNIWWIVTWIVRARAAVGMGWRAAYTMPVRILGITRFREVGYPDPKPIGIILVGTAIAWVVWRGRKGLSFPAAALVAGWCVCIYAMLSAQVHENHAYLAVPFLALAAGQDRTLRPIFWAVSAMTAFNMYIFYGLGTDWSPVVNRRWTVVDMTVVAALLNVALCVWMTVRVRRALNWDGLGA
jgi:hypothetical protein